MICKKRKAINDSGLYENSSHEKLESDSSRNFSRKRVRFENAYKDEMML